MADIGFVAACPYLVIIRKIDIENKFFGKGTKCGGFTKGFTVTRICGIRRTDFETRRVEA